MCKVLNRRKYNLAIRSLLYAMENYTKEQIKATLDFAIKVDEETEGKR